MAQRLCWMRGATLKVGQMLSVHNKSVLPPALTMLLIIVCTGTVAMPEDHLWSLLAKELGNNNNNNNWERTRGVAGLDLAPMAAAINGQVHQETLSDG